MFHLYKTYIYLAGILAGAFLLRIWGIDFGLPHIYHTDEWFEVKRALKLGQGVFDFDRAGKGGYFYLLFVEYGLYYVFLRFLGHVQSAQDFLVNIFRDPTDIWLIGRVTTAVIGTLNCYLMYLLGKRTHSTSVGLIAALLMAVYIEHVKSSHYITVDIPLTFLITLTLLMMLWNPDKVPYTTSQYALLGLVAAACVVTKITAAPILPATLVFHYKNVKLRNSRVTARLFMADRRFICFVITFAVSVVLAEPGYLIEGIGVFSLAHKLYNPGSEGLAWPIAQQPKPVLFYLGVLFPLRYIVFSICCVGGMILSVKQKLSPNYILLPYGGLYFLLLAMSQRPEWVFSRYVLPLVPVLVYYSAIGVDYVLRQARESGSLAKTMAFAAMGILVIFVMGRDSVAFGVEKTKRDTRTIAKEWFDREIPSGRKIFIEGTSLWASTMTVPLKITPSLVDVVRPVEGRRGRTKSLYYESLKEALKVDKTHSLIMAYDRDRLAKALDQKDGDYAVLLENMLSKFEQEVNRKAFPEVFRLIRWLESDEFELVKVFRPDKATVGPTILVYERKNHRAKVSLLDQE